MIFLIYFDSLSSILIYSSLFGLIELLHRGLMYSRYLYIILSLFPS